MLRSAETSASVYDWNAAGQYTDKAMELWEKRRAYFYVTLFHGETDAIYENFCEVKKLIEYKQYGEYSAANARSHRPDRTSMEYGATDPGKRFMRLPTFPSPSNEGWYE